MGNTKIPTLTLILIVGSLVATPAAIRQAHAAGPPTVFVSPGSRPLAPLNTLVTFNVSVSNIPADTPLAGWDIVVAVGSYDQSVLKPVSIDLIETFGGTASEFSHCIAGVGIGCSGADGSFTAHSAASTLSNSYPSGNITLFSVTFNATGASGYTSISLEQDIGQSLVSDPTGAAINVDVSGAVYGNAASAPVAVFSWSPFSPYIGEPVAFNATMSYDPSGGTVTTYFWPGRTTTLPVTTLVFFSPGNQSVTLTVKDDKGLLSLPTTHFINVRVHCPPGQSTVHVPSDCLTISSAIDSVTPGGTILVAAGNYSENIAIRKPLILQGAGRDSTFLTGTAQYPDYPPGIGSYAQNVTVSGFTISDSATGALVISSSGNTIANNTILGTVRITASTLSPANLADNVLVNNTLNDVEIQGNPPTILSNNIITVDLSIDSSPGCILRGNTIANFRVSGSTIEDYVQDIDLSNRINGKPVYYVVGVSNPIIPVDAGYLGFVNSSNITIGPDLPTLAGITLAGTQNVQISGVRVAGPSPGPGVFPPYTLGLDIAFSSNIVIQNSTFEGPYPISPFFCCHPPLDNRIDSSNNVVVQNSIFLQSRLDVQDSTSMVAAHNTVLIGRIVLSASNGAQIVNNNFTSTPQATDFGVSFAGILLLGSNSSMLAQNSISDYGVGIWLLGSHSNLLEANVIHGGRCLFCYLSTATGGILVQNSPQNILRNNQIIGAYWSLQVSSRYFDCIYNPAEPCQKLVDYAQDIDPSNTIDGRPIYYLVGTHDKTIPTTAGYVAIVNSTRVMVNSINLSYSGDGIQIIASSDVFVEDSTVNATSPVGLTGLDSENLTISGNRLIPLFGIGISLAHCSNVIVEGNIIQFPNLKGFLSDGVQLVNTSNSTIEGNYVSNYSYAGISMRDSTDDTISRNTVFSFITLFGSGTPYGILIEQTGPDPTHNLVIGNTIADNVVGLWASPGNTIYHNNFLNNFQETRGSGNVWDNGAGQGNYWTDYKGNDTDGDGVGDTLLPHLGLDQYPLIQPWTPSGLAATFAGRGAFAGNTGITISGNRGARTIVVTAKNSGTAPEWIQAVFNITAPDGSIQTIQTLPVWVPNGQTVKLSVPAPVSRGSYSVTVQLKFSSDAFLAWTTAGTRTFTIQAGSK